MQRYPDFPSCGYFVPTELLSGPEEGRVGKHRSLEEYSGSEGYQMVSKSELSQPSSQSEQLPCTV